MRALVVLAVFVASTVLLLGVIHPVPTTASSSTPGQPAAATTTTTTTTTHPVPTTTTIPPSRVPVMVANASGVPGAAASTRNVLQPGGWDLLAPVNATTTVPTSNVYYLAGFEPQAKSIASTLHLPASAAVPYTTAAPISSIGAAQVLVVVGPDVADGVGKPTAATTATTAH